MVNPTDKREKKQNKADQKHINKDKLYARSLGSDSCLANELYNVILK